MPRLRRWRSRTARLTPSSNYLDIYSNCMINSGMTQYGIILQTAKCSSNSRLEPSIPRFTLAMNCSQRQPIPQNISWKKRLPSKSFGRSTSSIPQDLSGEETCVSNRFANRQPETMSQFRIFLKRRRFENPNRLYIVCLWRSCRRPKITAKQEANSARAARPWPGEVFSFKLWDYDREYLAYLESSPERPIW